MIYKYIYKCRRCAHVFRSGRVNGEVKSEEEMNAALDRIPGSKITCEIFHACFDDVTGIADLIGAERE